MNRRSLLAMFAVGSAGCLRFADGGSTPEPTPSVDYPSGLTASGVEPTLFDAHASKLIDKSFTASFSFRNATEMRERSAEFNVGSDAIRGAIKEDGVTEVYGILGESGIWWRT